MTKEEKAILDEVVKEIDLFKGTLFYKIQDMENTTNDDELIGRISKLFDSLEYHKSEMQK